MGSRLYKTQEWRKAFSSPEPVVSWSRGLDYKLSRVALGTRMDARFFQLRSQGSLFLFFVLAKKRLNKGLTLKGILRGFTDILFTTGEKRKKR